MATPQSNKFNPLYVKRGGYEDSKEIVFGEGELIWLTDRSKLKMGNSQTKGGVDFVTEEITRRLVDLKIPLNNREFRYTNSEVEMVTPTTLELYTISFRRDIDKVFVLLKYPSNNINNWYELDSLLLYGKESIFKPSITGNSWYRVANLPYGSGSCTVRLFSNSPLNRFSITASFSVFNSRKIILNKILESDISETITISSIKLTNNQMISQEGANIEIFFKNDAYEVFCIVETDDVLPTWNIKSFETAYTTFSDSTEIVVTPNVGFVSTSNIVEGNKMLSEKYVSSSYVNFDTDKFKENLALKGLAVDNQGRLTLNGQVVFTPV
jgi:hypothetical protein